MPLFSSMVNQEAVKNLALTDVKERIANAGAHAVGSSPEEFRGFIKKELATWSKLIQETGIRAD